MPIEYRKNPATGAMAPFDTAAGAFVGTAAPMPAVTSMFPPKPAQEVTTIRPIVSPMGTEAIKQKELAAGEHMAAQEQLGGVEKTIAEQTAPIAQEKTGFLEQQQADAEARRVAREAQKARHLLGRDEQIKAEADAQVKAGNAKQDLLGDGWGAFLAALLTGIGTAAHLFQGGSGPSPAERVLDKRIGAHKEKLMAEWEALKSTRELKDRDHAAYLDAQRDREDEVSKDVQRQLQVYEARVQGIAARMQPEKQQALTRLATAETAKLAAKEKEQDSQRFDAKQSVTTRTAAPGMEVKPAPQASIQDVDDTRTVEENVKKLKALRETIATNPKAFEAVQRVTERLQREQAIEDVGSVPYVGAIPKIAVNIERAIRGGADKRLSGDKHALDVHRGVEEMANSAARALGPNATQSEIANAKNQLGVVGRTPDQFIEVIDKQIAAAETRAAEMRRQRSFR